MRRSPDAILQRTKDALGRVGLAPHYLPTQGPGEAGALARSAIEHGADLVLALGGDGTINEIAQGVVGTPVPMGILPGGTANCLANELGLGSRVDKAAAKLVECEPVRISVGRAVGQQTERYFLLMCGAGLDAAIVKEVNQEWKRTTGKLAYWAAGLAQFRRAVAAMRLRVDNREIDCGFALASRIRNYGGDLEIASGASLRKHDFEVVTFQGESPLRYAFYMTGVGIRVVQKLPGVDTRRAQCIQFLTPIHTQVDGEYFGCEPMHVEIVPDALTLLIPPSY
jgi:diacylglycerol kinase (ATP)